MKNRWKSSMDVGAGGGGGSEMWGGARWAVWGGGGGGVMSSANRWTRPTPTINTLGSRLAPASQQVVVNTCNNGTVPRAATTLCWLLDTEQWGPPM